MKKKFLTIDKKQYELIKELIDDDMTFIRGGSVTTDGETTTNTINDFDTLPQTGDDKAQEMGKDFNIFSYSGFNNFSRMFKEMLNSEDIVMDNNLDLNEMGTLLKEPYNALELYRSLSTFLKDLNRQQNTSYVQDINAICLKAILPIIKVGGISDTEQNLLDDLR